MAGIELVAIPGIAHGSIFSKSGATSKSGAIHFACLPSRSEPLPRRMFSPTFVPTGRLLMGTTVEAQHPAYTAAQVPAAAPRTYSLMSHKVAPTFRDTTGRRLTARR